MGVFNWFTNKFMGKIEEEVEIVDGVVVIDKEINTVEVMKEPEPEEKKGWEVPEKYKEHMLLTKKVRTVKEYCIDLVSFGVPVEEITCDQIENRINPLTEATQRRKITALNSYAKWLLISGETGLLVVLGQLNERRKRK